MIDQVFDYINKKSKEPDSGEELEEEDVPEQLDQRLFVDKSFVNDVQDKIQYDGCPVLEEVENLSWVQ